MPRIVGGLIKSGRGALIPSRILCCGGPSYDIVRISNKQVIKKVIITLRATRPNHYLTKSLLQAHRSDQKELAAFSLPLMSLYEYGPTLNKLTHE